ncbi:hypothetical protein C3408_15895 [Candidatus Pantoea alvi]|nr:hypothetical protein C3408_15895 [Pantoea alvi]
MPLRIRAHLHGYAVKSVLQGLVHADVSNVRFWHKADVSIKNLMAPSGSPALPGRRNLLC